MRGKKSYVPFLFRSRRTFGAVLGERRELAAGAERGGKKEEAPAPPLSLSLFSFSLFSNGLRSFSDINPFAKLTQEKEERREEQWKKTNSF